KTTDIFSSHALDTLFNLASITTDQGIHLAGILTEAIHTPHMHDRATSLNSINTVFQAARHFGKEIEFKKNGFIARRAQKVLDEAERFLEQIDTSGLMKAISRGKFANIRRPINSGKGAEDVFKKGKHYSNPIMDILEAEGSINEQK
ncbi:MAG: lysine 5,6-aminomutase subunit alpha, partial [Desulfobacterales bacterium]